MGNVKVENGDLIANGELFPLNFNFMTVITSSLRKGDYSLFYSHGISGNYELMLGVTNPVEGLNNLKSILESLNDKNFVFIDDIAIVNLNNVKEVKQYKNPEKNGVLGRNYGEVKFIDGNSYKLISKSGLREMKKLFNEKSQQKNLQ